MEIFKKIFMYDFLSCLTIQKWGKSQNQSQMN